MDPLVLFLVIGVIGWAIAGPPPRSTEYRKARRQHRVKAKAEALVARKARQALRRRVFGSHPVLYWALAWLSPVLLLGLLTGL